MKHWMEAATAQNTNERALNISLQGRARPWNSIGNTTKIPDILKRM